MQYDAMRSGARCDDASPSQRWPCRGLMQAILESPVADAAITSAGEGCRSVHGTVALVLAGCLAA